MTARINELLTHLESKHEVEILYACESGSRAWGFASPDSDYDIRFLYRRPVKKCYLVTGGSDAIEVPVENGLDPGGWELRKALALLAKSNGTLIEWLHSPLVYRANTDFLNDLRSLSKNHFSRKHLANHYRGMAHKIIGTGLQSEAPTGKSYLYALRAVLSARFVVERGGPPPVEFGQLLDLLPRKLRGEVERLVIWKETAGEQESPGRKLGFDYFLRESLEKLAHTLENLPDDTPDKEPFNEILHKWTLWPSRRPEGRFAKSDFTPERVRRKDLLLFEAMSGSRAFGTHHEKSDTDLRGVFVAPDGFLTGLETIEQVSDEKSDEVYYEVGRFIDLLLANNPNLVELLFTPKGCVRYRDVAFDLIKPEDFLSKLCRKSFGSYAMGQIRKARGLKKKIVNPEPEERKHLREFCHVLVGQGSLPLTEWLTDAGLAEKDCVLVAVNHAAGTYALFHHPAGRGIFTKKDDAVVLCSSVPREAKPLAWMNGNPDAFKAHCRAHRDYWKWVEERNEERYQTNASHGRDYDSKNLMHTLRLLDQATEIAQEGRIIMPRPNVGWLKSVKSGRFEFEDLLKIAEEKNSEMEAAFDESTLMESPSRERAEEVLLAVRDWFGR